MQYKIIVTDQKGSTMNVRLKIPFNPTYADETNSTWHAEGGKLKFSNGTCLSHNDTKFGTPVSMYLSAMERSGVLLNNFFTGITMQHASGGSGEIYSGWGGSTMVPGPISWVDDD